MTARGRLFERFATFLMAIPSIRIIHGTVSRILTPSVFGLVVLSCHADTPSPPAAPMPPPQPTVEASPVPREAPACDEVALAADAAREQQTRQTIARKAGTMGVASRAAVATGHRLATEVGLQVLREGGSAVDAFIAAALTEDLVLPGVTSTAGLVGMTVYDARTRLLRYVHGGLASPADPRALWHDGDTAPARMVTIPGAVAAYQEASHRYGKKRWADVLKPVIALARRGFAIDELYARSIARNWDKLLRSPYGKRTFFAGETPLGVGDVLRQPEVAATLEGLAAQGADFMYRGRWAHQLVATVQAGGGGITLDDLARYAPEVIAPLHERYREYEVHTSAGTSTLGGARLLMQLGALARFDVRDQPPPWESAGSLALLLRVHDLAAEETWVTDRSVIGDVTQVDGHLARSIDAIARQLQQASPPGGVADIPAAHSSAVAVADEDGNYVVGTHTIETLNWGEGLFVGGLPLSTSAPTVSGSARPGKMAFDPLSNTIVTRDDGPAVLLATFGTGLDPADVQVLTNVLDRGLDAEAAVLAPRLGYFSVDLKLGKVDKTTHVIDPRIPRAVACAVAAQGLNVTYRAAGDTGFPVLLVVDDRAPGRARLQGMTPERLDGAAVGY